MKEPWLFPTEELVPQPLSPEQKNELIHSVINNAQIGHRYMYEVRETCGMLHVTYDEMQTLLNYYKLDCVIIRDTIVRIPWWSLAEYLIDPADDVETAMYEYLKSLPHGRIRNIKTA